MKYILLIILILLIGCQNKEWTNDEQIRFNVECVEAGKTIEYCQCLLQCLQIEYNNYNSAFKKIEFQHTPETLNICITECK